MHFVHQKKDEPLRIALINEGVVRDEVLTKLLGDTKRESGHLFEDVLIPRANELDGREWIYWLIRRHGLHRVNGLRVTPDFILAEKFTAQMCKSFCQWQFYPVAKTDAVESYAVAVGRPDYIKEALSMLGEGHTLLAATPVELAAIYRVYLPFA